MSMVSGVIGGVDTHVDVHVAAALDLNGGLLGIESFPVNEAGYCRLAEWLAGFGPVVKIGVEGTGSYSVGLARHLHDLLVEWLTNLREADQALATRAAAAGSWDEFSRSAENRAYESTLVGGSGVCNDFQLQLDATAARGVFTETPWMPGDLKDMADAVIGCDSIPVSLDAALGR